MGYTRYKMLIMNYLQFFLLISGIKDIIASLQIPEEHKKYQTRGGLVLLTLV